LYTSRARFTSPPNTCSPTLSWWSFLANSDKTVPAGASLTADTGGSDNALVIFNGQSRRAIRQRIRFPGACGIRLNVRIDEPYEELMGLTAAKGYNRAGDVESRMTDVYSKANACRPECHLGLLAFWARKWPKYGNLISII
jgi:hypothetical protein